MINDARIAQLIERNLAKVEVAGLSPVSRSNLVNIFQAIFIYFQDFSPTIIIPNMIIDF